MLAAEARSVALDVCGDFEWRRGPLVEEGDSLTIRLTESYRPANERGIWEQLVRVKTADDARAFLKAYGPLKLQFPDGEPHGFLDAGETTQAIDDVISTAGHLRRIAHTLARVRQVHEGDREALSQLRQVSKSRRIRRLPKRQLLAEFGAGIAARLSEPISTCEMRLVPSLSEPGRLTFTFHPQNLEQYCFLKFARAAAAQTLIRICPGCAGVFHTDDPRQEHCGTRCATRVRVARFRQQRRRRA